MRKSLVGFLLGSIFISILMSTVPGFSSNLEQKPWMQPYTPTLIQWIVLKLNLMHKDTRYAGGVAYFYKIDKESYEKGIVKAELHHKKNAPAKNVTNARKLLTDTLEYEKNAYPWLKYKIETFEE